MTSVLIPFGPQFLALEPEELAQARDRAREILGTGWATDRVAAATTQSPEKLLTAEAMEALTGVPATWFLEQARRGELPHHKFGKYVWFRLDEVLAVSGEGEKGMTNGYSILCSWSAAFNINCLRCRATTALPTWKVFPWPP